MRAGIALGSNLGDRQSLLTQALCDLRSLHEEGEFLASPFLETAPQDCPPGSPSFLNAVVEIETSLSPLVLLEVLQRLEVKAGRFKNHGFHEPRTLDLDILYYGAEVLDEPALQLPHPRIRERYFVLKPLADIRPNLTLHGWSNSCMEYLLQISNKCI
jgi:2-amino-4-hydroxy-6-hydroxymethyldihydropteridine diphosphokinase